MEGENITMTDNEYEVLDQLYFVISFSELKDLVNVKDELLDGILWS